MLPKSGRPRLERAKVEEIIADRADQLRPTDKVVLVAIRGYYRRMMGNPTANDRGIYDDALFIVTPDRFAAFNANTDPSRHRTGIASLVTGVHRYRKGKHGITKGPGKAYPALRPASDDEQLPVTRDGVLEPKPGVAINIHRGGAYSTSSEGCQTVYPTQWDEFITMVYHQMTKHGQDTVPYILVDGE